MDCAYENNKKKIYYRFDEKKVYKIMHMSKDFKIVELKLKDYRNSIIAKCFSVVMTT